MPATLPTTDPVHSGLSDAQKLGFIADYAQQLAAGGSSNDPGEDVIPCTTAAWTAAQSLTGGMVTAANAIDNQHRHTLVSTNVAHAGYVRQFLNLSGSANWLGGKINEIDTTKPWTLRLAANPFVASAGFRYTLFVGGITIGAPPTAGGALTTKGWGFTIVGTGTGTATIQALCHDGTSQGAGTAAAITADGNLMCLCLKWTPGTGLALTVDNVLLSTAATNLPTGLFTGSANGWASLLEHLAGTVATQQINFRPIRISPK